MELRLTIPDNVAAILQQHWPEDDIPRHVLEDLVLQWYQDDILTEEEVRQALGFETRIQVYELLKQRGVPSTYTAEDFDADMAAYDRPPPVMLAVTNTSPLLYLVLIEQVDLLRALYGQVMVPRAVAGELQHPSAPENARAWVRAP